MGRRVFGYGNGNFGWNDPVTREQAVVLLYRYAQANGLDVSTSADLSKFTDMDDISDWALVAMKWAVAVGIIQGRPGNKAAPQGTSTRAEIAVIFKRYLDEFLYTAGDGTSMRKWGAFIVNNMMIFKCQLT
ncbi:MAG: S-layer homology domain-containing protein [Oscillospiraceae bacterium]|nr:S-layer homology domain-containing protein [Oscillospiraceae bacterium]